ncbi:MAG: hypothetical protein MJK18_06905, partial [Bdellovibrionales bacterium]|nr:hypothetical protein [Bdellovibrionales bacterium]
MILIATSLIPQVGSTNQQCRQVFSYSNTKPETQFAIDLSHDIARRAQDQLENSSLKRSSRRGYAILIGAMVGSAALTTYLSTHLPSHLQFTSVFLSQVTTLGVFVLGAPIWEPLSSRFRKWAFGVRSIVEVKNEDHQGQLENTWSRTQEEYSLNAQMSRNV